MSNMTVSFYSKKHHDTVASAIKARATSSIELLCSPTLNQLLDLTNSICQCAGIENQVGIFVADSETDNPLPVNRYLIPMQSGYITRNGIVLPVMRLLRKILRK
jgi:hypothetical protein